MYTLNIEIREVSLKNYIREIYRRFDIDTIATANWRNFDSRYSKEFQRKH